MNRLFRQFGKLKYFYITHVAPDKNTKKWKALKNKYAGKRAFLIGNGPSLNETPLYLLKNDYTICFNRFTLLEERLNWSPYFYMCIDPEVLPNIAPEINEILGKVNTAFFHSAHAQKIIKDEKILYIHPIFKEHYFANALPLAGAGGTVAYAALQILFYLGFKEIYLAGVDQNYVIHTTAKTTKGIKVESQKDDDPNHFDPRYFGKGQKYHQPVENTRVRMIRAFTHAREAAKKKGIIIKNAGIGGMLEVYERINFTDLFDYTPDQVYALFSETIAKNASPEKVKAFLNSEAALTEIAENIDKPVFVAAKEPGKKIIPKLILRYIPFGPIDDKYIFIERGAYDETVKRHFL